MPPPKEELEILLDLARRGNMRAIRERADHLEQMDERFKPFAGKLRQHAEAFETRAVLALVKQYMEQNQ